MKQLRNAAFILLIILYTGLLQAQTPRLVQKPLVKNPPKSVQAFDDSAITPQSSKLQPTLKRSNSFTLGDGQNQDSFNPSSKPSPANPQRAPQRSNSLNLKNLQGLDDEADFFDAPKAPDMDDNYLKFADALEGPPVQASVAHPQAFFERGSTHNTAKVDIDTLTQPAAQKPEPHSNSLDLGQHGLMKVPDDAPFAKDFERAQANFQRTQSPLDPGNRPLIEPLPADAAQDIKRAQAIINPTQPTTQQPISRQNSLNLANRQSSPVLVDDHSEYGDYVTDALDSLDGSKKSKEFLNQGKITPPALSRQSSLNSLGDHDLANDDYGIESDNNIHANEFNGESAFEKAMNNVHAQGSKLVAQATNFLTGYEDPDVSHDNMQAAYNKLDGYKNPSIPEPSFVPALTQPTPLTPTPLRSSLKTPGKRESTKRVSFKAENDGLETVYEPSYQNEEVGTTPSTKSTTPFKFPTISSISGVIASRFKSAARQVTPQNIKAFTGSVIQSVMDTADWIGDTTNQLRGKTTTKKLTPTQKQQLDEAADELATDATTPGGNSSFLERNISEATFTKRFSAWAAKLVDRVYKLLKVDNPAHIKIINISPTSSLVPEVNLSYNNQTKAIKSATITYNGNTYEVGPENIKPEGIPPVYTITTNLYSEPIQTPGIWGTNVHNRVLKNTGRAFKGSRAGRGLEKIAPGTIDIVTGALEVNPNIPKGTMTIKYFTASGHIETDTTLNAQPKETLSPTGSQVTPDSATIKQKSSYIPGTQRTAPQVLNYIELEGAKLEPYAPSIAIARNKNNAIDFSTAQVTYDDISYKPSSQIKDSDGITTITYQGEILPDASQVPQPSYFVRIFNEGIGYAQDTVTKILGGLAKTTLESSDTYKIAKGNILAARKINPTAFDSAAKAGTDFLAEAGAISIKEIVVQHDPHKRTITTYVTKNMSGGAPAVTEEHVYNY